MTKWARAIRSSPRCSDQSVQAAEVFRNRRRSDRSGREASAVMSPIAVLLRREAGFRHAAPDGGFPHQPHRRARSEARRL